MVQTLHYCLFLLGECEWGGRIYGREVSVPKLILLAVERYCTLGVVNVAEQTSVLHLPQRVAHKDLCLCLELKYGNSLVHHCHQANRLLVETVLVLRVENWLEHLTRIVVVMLHCVGCKRH